MDSATIIADLQAWFYGLILLPAGDTRHCPIPLEFVAINRAETGMGTYGLLLTDSQQGKGDYFSQMTTFTMQVVEVGDTMEVNNSKTDEIAGWVIRHIIGWVDRESFPYGQMPANMQPQCGYKQNLDTASPRYGYAERVIVFSIWHAREEVYLQDY